MALSLYDSKLKFYYYRYGTISVATEEGISQPGKNDRNLPLATGLVKFSCGGNAIPEIPYSTSFRYPN